MGDGEPPPAADAFTGFSGFRETANHLLGKAIPNGEQRNRLKRQKNGSNKLFELLASAGYSALNQSREEKEVQKRVEKVQRSLRWHRPLLVSLRKYNATCTDIRSLYKLCSQRHESVRSTKQ